VRALEAGFVLGVTIGKGEEGPIRLRLGKNVIGF